MAAVTYYTQEETERQTEKLDGMARGGRGRETDKETERQRGAEGGLKR